MVAMEQYQRIRALYAEVPGGVVEDRYYDASHVPSRPQGYRYLTVEVMAPYAEVAHHLAILGAVAVASGGYLHMHVSSGEVLISVAVTGEPYPEDLPADTRGTAEVIQ